MPGNNSSGPRVPLCFANNFWGKDDAGVQPLLERMHQAKVTSDEVKAFYNARAAIEDEYARKLLSLCRKPLGSSESGTLRASLDTVRTETEAMSKAHQTIAAQMKSELEEPLAAHAGGMKERRKIIQSGIEKLLKVKIQQTQAVNKSRDRYEQDCLRIKGYLAQGHMVMGHEERKNKAKLEKTQIHLATSNNEYEHAVKALEETTIRWNREWKAACDKFQDLEEERLDFLKSSLWALANISSTVCVSDDGSCEKIRLSLEGCDVERDIGTFINERGTGQEIPDPPKYINFCRGDVDSQSDVSEEEGYSVAQFQRTMNPAFRTSSPQPSTLESHHNPQNTNDVETPRRQPITSPSRDTTRTLQNVAQANHAPPGGHQPRPGTQGGLPPGQVEALPTVPHNEYPMDGMTMYCRTAPPPSSDRSSAASPGRPISRDSQSDDSNPTSSSSYEPSSGKQSPTKLGAPPATANSENDRQVSKTKSGFFQNHSPFRRKSKHGRESRLMDASNVTAPSEHQGTTLTASSRGGMAGSTHPTQSPTRSGRESQGMLLESRHQSRSPEPVDPRANFQLNVGNNVFDVASPDAQPNAAGNQSSQTQDALDPIAQALAELKGVGKQSSARLSADRYHGIQTPAPSVTASSTTPKHAGASPTRRTTPPPSYDQPTRRLDAPQPAFTSAQMKQTRQKYVDRKQNMFGDSAGTLSPVRTDAHARTQSRPGVGGGSNSYGGYDVPRAVSPIPQRGVSPRPEAYVGEQRQGYRSMSPNPYHRSVRGQHPSRSPPKRDSDRRYAASGTQKTDHHRRGSADVVNTQLQLSPATEKGYDDPAHGRGRHVAVDRPMTYYGGSGQDNPSTQLQQRSPADGRVRSRSINDGRQFNQDGIPILHHARALYTYRAAIPVELSFTKGDLLAILRHQEDGWWEAEVVGKTGRPGLVPSNYLQSC